MNKKLTAFFTQYGLNVTGNIAYGALNGYETSVHFSAPFETSACYVHVSFYATPEQRQSIAASVMQLGLKGLMATTTLYGMSFIYSVVLTGTLIKNHPFCLIGSRSFSNRRKFQARIPVPIAGNRSIRKTSSAVRSTDLP